MAVNNIIAYWEKTAEEAYETAQGLLSLNHFTYSLFFCHLTVEKILKAKVVKNTGEEAPFGHNLLKLSERSGVIFTQHQLNIMDEINTFNIEARYDDYKFEFYKKATKEYTEKYFSETTKLYLWIKEQITK